MTVERKMTEPANRRNAATDPHVVPRRERMRAIVERLVEVLDSDRPAADWPWIRYPLWARSQEHARKIAKREGLRTTKIGRDLYAHRDDLDALAERNAIRDGAANDSDDAHAIDPEVAAAFSAGGSR